jgi:hypothetical protein
LREARAIDDRMHHERQRSAAVSRLDERRIDIDHAIAEARFKLGTAVMWFVGMQDVALAGKAMPLRSPEVTGLDPREGHPDGVGVMTVHREGLTVEMSLKPFDAVGARCDPDTVAAASLFHRARRAQRFKTLPVVIK